MANSDPKKEWIACIQDVSNENNADIYVLSGGMNRWIDDNVIETVNLHKSKPKAFLILTTYGGDADVAYRIARCFQQSYIDGFTIFVPIVCKSAGTLLSIGSTELVMEGCAHLGPLDVQLGKPDEIGEMISGLTPVQALSFLEEHTLKLFEHYFLQLITRSGFQITTKTSSEIATKLTVGMFQPVYDQLDPLKLGEYHRNMMVAVEYGKRLMSNGNVATEDLLRKLTHGYPSHGFVIDRDEAKTIFKNVRLPNKRESEMAERLKPFIYEDLLNKDERKQYVAKIRYINPNIEETDKQDTDRKEDTINDEGTNENNQSNQPTVKTAKPEPEGDGSNISNPDNPETTDAESVREESDRTDSD